MAKTIMIQGTMSGVGKSILTAGLCRIFAQDGYRTAPFKSQNMALNSFVTKDGLEIGRAQALQAFAAYQTPTEDMNPILLKPVNDTGSEVIVNGKTVRIMPAKEYFEYKKSLYPIIREAYERLAAENDVIVIEGAGSPAEINLKKNDIVNMGIAEMTDAPVLLVGDIDRGGVFAQLVGTLDLLEKAEQERIAGFLINKFRGNKELLEPGLQMLSERTKKPVLGVIPYLNLDLEDEDSLTDRFSAGKESRKDTPVKIAVICFPRISNFTDLQLLSSVSCIDLYYVRNPRELKDPDLIILPGSRSTMGDLMWLKKSGLKDAILQKKEEGSILLGICGGYQMLGKTVSDPYHTEGESFAEKQNMPETLQGLDLLPVNTVLRKNKIRKNSSGRIMASAGFFGKLKDLTCEGYEIHTGKTSYEPEADAFFDIPRLGFSETEGCVSKDGSVCGTCIHGFLDSDILVKRITELLLQRKGLPAEEIRINSLKTEREIQLNSLADALRESLDLPRIREVMGL